MEGVDRAARVSLSRMKRNGAATVKTHGGAGEAVRKDHVKKSSVKNPLGTGTHEKSRNWLLTSVSCCQVGLDFKD